MCACACVCVCPRCLVLSVERLRDRLEKVMVLIFFNLQLQTAGIMITFVCLGLLSPEAPDGKVQVAAVSGKDTPKPLELAVHPAAGASGLGYRD